MENADAMNSLADRHPGDLVARSPQYQRLPVAEKREALQAAAFLCRRRTQLLERDIWVVATLGVLRRPQ